MMGRDEALEQLIERSRLAPLEDLPLIMTWVAPLLGAAEIAIYVVDYHQSILVPLAGRGAPKRDRLAIEGTLAGHVFRHLTPAAVESNGHFRLWLPLLYGMERLGVVEVVADQELDDQHHRSCVRAAQLLAELLLTRRMCSDAFESTRRDSVMQVPAEIIFNLLPPLTFATDKVVVTAILEPCYEIGGDAFDYAVNGDTTHVSVFDAMGHSLHASLLATVALGAYRNARRCGLDLLDAYRSIDKWVRSRFPDSFLTATLAELNTATGQYRAISAGHLAVLLLRHGRVVKSLPAPTALPLGLTGLGDFPVQVAEESLEPGDRLLLYTDGILEARAETGELFGFDRLVEFMTRMLADQLPPPETMRRLIHAILDHQHGELQDDAMAVLVEWRP